MKLRLFDDRITLVRSLRSVTFGRGGPETSEHWSFFCVEKSFWEGGLAPHRGHGYALEEYAIRRRRITLKLYCVVVVPSLYCHRSATQVRVRRSSFQ